MSLIIVELNYKHLNKGATLMSASQFTIYLIESNKDFDDTVDLVIETFNMNDIEDVMLV